MDAARALLDSLMGAERDKAPEEKKAHFTDREHCKFWLIDFCPHECFIVATTGKPSQNSPLGDCPKTHAEVMKMQFKGSRSRRSYVREYEKELMRYLKKLVVDCDHRIERDRNMIERMGSDTKRRRAAGLTPMNNDQMIEHRIIQMKGQMAQKMKEAQDLGESGKIAQSAEIMKEVENLKLAITNHETSTKRTGVASAVESLDDTFQEDVCETCGLTIDWRCAMEIDNRRRGVPHPHETGSYHQGFKEIRKKLEELEDKYVHGGGFDAEDDISSGLSDEKSVYQEDLRVEIEKREHDRERDRDRRDDRGRDRDRRDDRDRERDRERERDRRDRDRDRDRRDDRNRDRDRERRGDRDRDRGRDRDRR